MQFIVNQVTQSSAPLELGSVEKRHVMTRFPATRMTPEEIELAYKMRMTGLAWIYVAKRLGLNQETVRRSVIEKYGECMTGHARYAGIPLDQRQPRGKS